MDSNIPDEGPQGLEVEVVEPGVARVRADDLGDVDKALEHDIGKRHHALLDDNQNTHDTAHQELVLLHLFRGWIPLNQLEDVLQEILGKRCDFGGGNHGLSLGVGKE